MSKFDIQTAWLPVEGASTEVEATACALIIRVKDSNVTAYSSESEGDSDRVEVPAYYLAEWIAENWWPLLCEPRKSEDGIPDEPDFLYRHSTLVAQHGFALPHILIVPNGTTVSVTALPRYVQFADVRFSNRSKAFVPRRLVEEVLGNFVQSTVGKLVEAGITDTNLQEHWEAIQNTSEEEHLYCSLMGALGLSPYANHPEIDEILSSVVETMGEVFATDLCLVARPHEFRKAARAAKLAVKATVKAPEIKLDPILSIPVPPENLETVAWRRGVRAADRLRDKLGISEKDTKGSARLFDALRVDPSQRTTLKESEFQPEGAAIVGAVCRDGATARASFIQKHEAQRRFAAARAVFSAWVSGPRSGHLLTQAVTRHQQASRAFAAEILAPIAFIRSQATRSKLTFDEVSDIAAQLNVGTDVVYKQATNNGLSVTRH